MPKIPRGERLVLTLVGKRNAGKSSLINSLTGQEIAIVSEEAGTTTDPVAKQYELLPLGPVTFYDTAGIDDVGELGEKRVKSTRKILWRTDIALMVIGETGISKEDKNLISELQYYKIPFIVVFNKSDVFEPTQKDLDYCSNLQVPSIIVSSKKKINITQLKEMLVAMAPSYLMHEKVLISDLVKAGDLVILVVPIDLAAPKGRLILPQVQVLRELLDNDAMGLIVKERELEAAFEKFSRKPDLVITDSQVVLKVAGDVPSNIRFTTFSTLFARYKGELDVLVQGAEAADTLENGDKILIAEACSHHVQADDIGRVKIPRWIRQYTGMELEFDVFGGHDFPDSLEEYKLVVHCGACMLNQAEMRRRIQECQRRNVPICNYGIMISKVQGLLERVIEPFYHFKGRFE